MEILQSTKDATETWLNTINALPGSPPRPSQCGPRRSRIPKLVFSNLNGGAWDLHLENNMTLWCTIWTCYTCLVRYLNYLHPMCMCHSCTRCNRSASLYTELHALCACFLNIIICDLCINCKVQYSRWIVTLIDFIALNYNFQPPAPAGNRARGDKWWICHSIYHWWLAFA